MENHRTAIKHTVFQLLMAAIVIAALFLSGGCSFTVQVPNTFEFIMYEDCSWEVIETGMGVQLFTGTTSCN